MQTQTDLQTCFQCDIDRITQEFIDEFGLKYEQETANLTDPLLRWLDFVCRHIQLVPRKIIASSKFPKVPHVDAERALTNLLKLIESGSDINPYQSKGLILHNDTSGEKRQRRTDLLWADWGIHHLHLTDVPLASGSYFSERSPWLLFCIVGSDFLGLIDVRNHGEKDLFSDPDLIKTVAESWPEIMERYRIKGILAPSKSHPPNEVSALRKGGLTSFVKIGSHAYMGPGMGLTSASTSTRVSLAVLKVRRYVRELAKTVFDPNNQFKKEALASGVTNPEFNLRITERGMAVYEKSESKAFLLPRVTSMNSLNFLAELHDLIAPSWVINFVLNKNP